MVFHVGSSLLDVNMKPQHEHFSVEIAAVILVAIIAFACWVGWDAMSNNTLPEDHAAGAVGDPNERIGDAWGRAWGKRREVEDVPW